MLPGRGRWLQRSYGMQRAALWLGEADSMCKRAALWLGGGAGSGAGGGSCEGRHFGLEVAPGYRHARRCAIHAPEKQFCKVKFGQTRHAGQAEGQ